MAHNSALYLLTAMAFYNAQTFVKSYNYLDIRHFVSDPFHGDPVPYPEQENCDDITARKLCGAGSSVRPIVSQSQYNFLSKRPLPIFYVKLLFFAGR